MTLSGCFTDISKTGLSVSVAAPVATALATVAGGPVVGATVGIATGVTTDIVVNEEDITVSTLEALPEGERTEALKAQYLWETIEKLGMWSIAAVLGFFLFPIMIGYLMPNRRQRRLEKMAFDHPDIKAKDI